MEELTSVSPSLFENAPEIVTFKLSQRRAELKILLKTNVIKLKSDPKLD